MRIFISTVIAAAALSAAAAEVRVEPVRAKLLHVGWDMANPAKLRDHYREMEAAMPFDGVIIPMTNADGWGASLYIWTAGRWEEEIFDRAVADLQSCEFTRFTDNFAMAWVSPGPVAWDDDAAWADIASKFGILARAARDAGLKGLCFDPEPYMQFNWGYDPDSGLSETEAVALARRRGREIMAALASEYPGMTLISFWMYSLPAARADLESALQDGHWGLYGSFLNGMWDAAPPEMKIADLNESGYNMSNTAGVQHNYLRVKRGGFPQQDPANLERYRRQISSGFGFYLDPYVDCRPGWIRHDGTQLATLLRNMSTLLSASDDYVWFYSETGCFFGSESDEALWENQLPGLTRALALARRPADFVPELRRAAADGKLANLVANPDFRADPELRRDRATRSDWVLLDEFPGYDFWFETAAGTAELAETGGRREGRAIRLGGQIMALNVPVAAVPGSTYCLEAWYKAVGPVQMAASVGMVTPSGEWVVMDCPMTTGETDADGFTCLNLILGPVPETAEHLVMVLVVRPGGEGAAMLVDDIAVYRMDDLL